LLGGSPWLILIFIPILAMFFYTQRYYRSSGREIQRIEAITRSPIYSLFSETLQGLPTIRAFGVQPIFILRNQTYLDINSKCFFINQMVT
jgi:ABC-type multidrug transport system fused ATPase/permease subunit